MTKLLLSLVILLGAWCIGQSKGALFRRRLSVLRQFTDGLTCMESEIRSFCTPLPRAFAAAGAACPIFARAAALSETEPPEKAFLLSLSSFDQEKEALRILSSFARGFSLADAQGQLENITHCRQRLLTYIERTESEFFRLEKLYSGAGIMTGALIVILLL